MANWNHWLDWWPRRADRTTGGGQQQPGCSGRSQPRCRASCGDRTPSEQTRSAQLPARWGSGYTLADWRWANPSRVQDIVWHWFGFDVHIKLWCWGPGRCEHKTQKKTIRHWWISKAYLRSCWELNENIGCHVFARNFKLEPATGYQPNAKQGFRKSINHFNVFI